MFTWKEARENPELMIKYKDDLKDVEIFKDPWTWVFINHPHLYREFLDRAEEMGEWEIHNALFTDPTLVLDLKEYLYRLDEEHANWNLTEVSLCLKHRDNPDKFEAAYYITFPYKLDNLNNEEKREMGKRIIELLKEEKI
jgi:hypothetical protein